MAGGEPIGFNNSVFLAERQISAPFKKASKILKGQCPEIFDTFLLKKLYLVTI